MRRSKSIHFKGCFTLFMAFFTAINTAFALSAPSFSLTLAEAEQLAVQNEPSLKQIQSNAKALHHQAVAAGQLPDPKLVVGAVNVPTNNFSMTEDPMTMIEVGVKQAFPAGKTLQYKSHAAKALAQAEQIRHHEQTQLLIREIRNTWLELYYQTHALQTIQATQKLLKGISKSTEARYASGSTTQQNLIETQLELSNIQDKTFAIQQEIATLRATLSRWVGNEIYQRPLSQSLPHWSISNENSLIQKLMKHPLLQQDAQNVSAARHVMRAEKEQYKPAFDVGVSYGFRQGNNSMSADASDDSDSKRPDMMSAQIQFDLPIFPKERQTRRVKASAYQLESAQLAQQVHYRDLVRALKSTYENWKFLKSREDLFTRHVLPEAKQNAKAALLAYKNATSDLNNVLKSQILVLNTELQLLRISVDRAKAEAALKYLVGD